MNKVRLFAVIGLALGMGSAFAGLTQCQQICQAQYNACRAAATTLDERSACFEARYECNAQCN